MTEFERFDEALDRLQADESPRAAAAEMSDEEQRMLQMAQLLRGSQGRAPEKAFVESLHDRLIVRPRRISRRTAFLSGAGALAAGLLAGVGLDRTVGGSTNKKQSAQPLVGSNGRWMRVARVAEVPDGAIRTFSAGAINGFLINRGGTFKALSRVCTHMACTLNVSATEQSFVCPCHGAEFDLDGWQQYKQIKRYGTALPPLPKLQVRVKGEHIEVWSV
ncbi:MAG TPA: Rieske (2Fe-2S) protein [Chloroflexota bacterium]